MIEKALLVYRRRLDQKKNKTKQCITQKHQLKNVQEKKNGEKKER